MIEWQLLEFELSSCFSSTEIIPRHRAWNCRELRLVTFVGNYNNLFDRGNLLHDFRNSLAKIDFLRCISVAIRTEQKPRLDLTESVEHSLHTEIGRARRPH